MTIITFLLTGILYVLLGALIGFLLPFAAYLFFSWKSTITKKVDTSLGAFPLISIATVPLFACIGGVLFIIIELFALTL
jgi:hypothetical protein